MSLKQRLTDDMKAAMRAKDSERLGAMGLTVMTTKDTLQECKARGIPAA